MFTVLSALHFLNLCFFPVAFFLQVIDLFGKVNDFVMLVYIALDQLFNVRRFFFFCHLLPPVFCFCFHM